MLRVTKLTDYATVVLTVLAARPGAVLSAPELAERSGLEQPTVAKLLKPLAAAGLDYEKIVLRRPFKRRRKARAAEELDALAIAR